jgi:hypothetical protein
MQQNQFTTESNFFLSSRIISLNLNYCDSERKSHRTLFLFLCTYRTCVRSKVRTYGNRKLESIFSDGRKVITIDMMVWVVWVARAYNPRESTCSVRYVRIGILFHI